MILSDTWFMDGYIDYELQKYRLLAYLQDVKRYFNETKLYPQLSDIVAHYNNLLLFRSNKQLMQDSFPRKLTGIDTEKIEMVYERMLTDSELMQELEDITAFAVAEMKDTISEGAEIYELIEKQMLIEPVGIIPLYKNEGYIFMRITGHSEVRIYNYTVSIFEHKDARYKGIKMTYVDSRAKNLANTYEQIKLDIVRDIRTLPNPAVYKVEFPTEIPFHETLLPIAKRSLVRYI
ncbi:hypothetical protein GCM10023093_31840 [Nemorincola caseinilytica]|uniref:Uncharacterized protein n=1 Tax=Nemorincola caseinilytica TaxID=2054315 RepID=A0ABP8NPX0_9BACT